MTLKVKTKHKKTREPPLIDRSATYESVAHESQVLEGHIRDLNNTINRMTALESISDGLIQSAPFQVNDEGDPVTNDEGELVPDLSQEVPLETRIMATSAATLVGEPPKKVVGELAIEVASDGTVALESLEPITYEIAIESILDTIKNIAESIWKFIVGMFESVVKFVSGHGNTMEGMEKEYDALIDKFKDDKTEYEVTLTPNNAIAPDGEKMQANLAEKVADIEKDNTKEDRKALEEGLKESSAQLNEGVKEIDKVIEGTQEVKVVKKWIGKATGYIVAAWNKKKEGKGESKTCSPTGKALVVDEKTETVKTETVSAEVKEKLEPITVVVTGTDLYNFAVRCKNALVKTMSDFKNPFFNPKSPDDLFGDTRNAMIKAADKHAQQAVETYKANQAKAQEGDGNPTPEGAPPDSGESTDDIKGLISGTWKAIGKVATNYCNTVNISFNAWLDEHKAFINIVDKAKPKSDDDKKE